MLYSIPVSERVFNRFNVWYSSDQSQPLLFRSIDENVKDTTLFVLIHGDNEVMGNVVISGVSVDLETLGKTLIETLDLKHKEWCKEVVTISCFGGYQKPVTIDGIPFKSIHTSKHPINMMSPNMMGWDDEYFIDFNTAE